MAPSKKSSTKTGTKTENTKSSDSRRQIASGSKGKTRAKKSTRTKGEKKPSSAQICWPGFEPTPGKAAGEKGSCRPKSKQTKAEKKGDQKTAAAIKLSGKR
jgi:hypothetical protein